MMRGIITELKNLRPLVNKEFDIVFYSESDYYYQYFEYLIDGLRKHNIKVCYLTSKLNDAIFTTDLKNVESYYCKYTLAYVFKNLKAKVVVLTMPDLQNYIIKRSPNVQKYIYIFHAILSTHQQYRSHAFDHYDCIFVVGPHQCDEIREAEKLYNIKHKEIVFFGYPLIQKLREIGKCIYPSKKRILIAPSWYSGSILHYCIFDIVDVFAFTDYEIVIRPHPEYLKRYKGKYLKLKKLIENYSNINFDFDPSLWKMLLSSNYIITDRSGIAFEFAFVKYRPVLFIDTPPKCLNSDLARFQKEPIENSYRNQIGIIVEQKDINKLPEIIAHLDSKNESYNTHIKKVETEILFTDSEKGLEYIIDKLS